jgi:hypothetical protein
VCWLKPSPTFPDWIPRGRRDPTSAAFDYFRHGRMDDEARLVAADEWLSRDRIDGSNVHIVEHSAVVPDLGAVFSRLWIPGAEARRLDLVSC